MRIVEQVWQFLEEASETGAWFALAMTVYTAVRVGIYLYGKR